MSTPRTRIGWFAQELRRRRVLRVAIIYAAAGWVAVEASDTIAPLLLLPDWTSTLVLVLLLPWPAPGAGPGLVLRHHDGRNPPDRPGCD